MPTDADGARMAVVAQSLQAIETDESATAEQLERETAAANEFRRDRGIQPLEEQSELPEEEFYRRARALGLRRISR